MAITRTAGAWVNGSTTCAPALPATPQAGDLHVIYIGGKPYSITIVELAGWTLITGTDGQNGTVASGTDVGSVRWAAFYRYWQSGDSGTPTFTVTGGNVVLGVAVRFRPTAGSTINTPAGCKGYDNTSGTDYSATMDANPGITTADVLNNFTTIAGNNSTFGTPTMTATGATIGAVTENPATEGTTTTGNDLEASASTAVVSSGSATAAPVVGWTLSVAQTGGGAFVRIRETVNHALTANGLSAGAPVLAHPTLSQVHGLTASGLAAGAPVLAHPSLAQVHALSANGLAAGAPVLAHPTLSVQANHALTANGLSAGAPVLATPTISQGHALTANALAAGAPVLATPAITQGHVLSAQGLAAGAPVLGTPTIAQGHVLTAQGLAIDAPVLGRPSLSQVHALVAQVLNMGAPVLAHPTLSGESLPDGDWDDIQKKGLINRSWWRFFLIFNRY